MSKNSVELTIEFVTLLYYWPKFKIYAIWFTCTSAWFTDSCNVYILLLITFFLMDIHLRTP